MARIVTLSDQGTAKNKEDGLLVKEDEKEIILVVLDGVSGLYLPNDGPKKFDGLSGGQMAVQIIKSTLQRGAATSLRPYLEAANFKLADRVSGYGLNLEETEFLPGASVAAVRITPNWTEMLSIGDCGVVCELHDSPPSATENQLREYDARLYGKIAELMEKHAGNKQEMWKEFTPFLAEARRKHVNTMEGKFSVVNGQTSALKFFQTASWKTECISKLVLFTDGFIPLEVTQAKNELASYVLSNYSCGGLESVLTETRRLARLKEAHSHEGQPEATAIAFTF